MNAPVNMPLLNNLQTQVMTPFDSPEDWEDRDPINPSTLDSERDLVQDLLAVFEWYRQCNERIVQERIWQACIWAYKGYKPIRTDPTKDSIVIKEIFRQCHTLKPQVFKQFFSQPELFKYMPQNVGAEDKMSAAGRMVHYQIEKYRIKQEIKNSLWSAMLLGNGYLHPSWQTFRRYYNKPMFMHDPKTGRWWDRPSREVIEKRPRMDFIPPNEFFSDPRCQDPRDSGYSFRWQIVSGAFLKTRVKEGFLKSEAIEKVSTDGLGATNESINTLYRLQTQSSDAYRLMNLPNDDYPHEMLTIWSNNGMEYVIIDKEVLARSEIIEGGVHDESGNLEPGQTPILTATNYPQFNMHYGIAEPYILLDEQKLLNDLYTMLKDTAYQSSGQQYKATTGGGKALANFSAGPGQIMWVASQDDVQVIPPMPYNQAIWGDIQGVRNNMKDETGVLDNIAGSSAGAKTATMGVKLQDAASARMEDKVDDLVPFMTEVYSSLYILNQRHLDDQVKFSISGTSGKAAFYSASPEDFDEPDVDVKIQLANAMDSDPETAAKWSQFYQQAGQDPGVNRMAVVKAWVRALDPRDPNQFLTDPGAGQTEALKENQDWEAFGTMPDPNPNEDVMTHYQIHTYEMSTPAFMQAHPIKQMMFMAHYQKTLNYLQFQMKQAGQQTQIPQAGPSGSPVPGTDTQTNNMFNNANAGAQIQGAPQPLPPGPGGPGPGGPQ